MRLLLAFFILCLAYFTRMTGFHIDENNYLIFATNQPWGDVAEAGKPASFYLLNYFLHNVPGALLGPWQFLSVQLFYTFLAAVSAVWASCATGFTQKQSRIFLTFLLAAPLFLLNSTQVMMETPLIALLTLVFGALLRIEHDESSVKGWVVFSISTVLAIMIKETALPAALTLGAAFFPLFKKHWKKMAAVLGVAVLFRWALQLSVHAPSHKYGGLSELFDPSRLFERISSPYAYDHLATWFFFVGPVNLLAIAFLAFKKRLGSRLDRSMLWAVALSGVGTLGIYLASTQEFARYCYPVIWIGSFAALYFLAKSPRWILVISGIFLLSPIYSMWIERERPLNSWPNLVSHELYHSGFTVLPGTPLRWWAATHLDARKSPCIFLPMQNTEKAWAVGRVFLGLTESPRFFDEAHAAEFEQCTGAKIIATRFYEDSGRGCTPECAAPAFKTTSCNTQYLEGWSAKIGNVINRTCLP